VVLAELEERGIGLILGYRPSSYEKFLLAPIRPPLVAFSGPSDDLCQSCVEDKVDILDVVEGGGEAAPKTPPPQTSLFNLRWRIVLIEMVSGPW
jgi:hypothetical protein